MTNANLDFTIRKQQLDTAIGKISLSNVANAILACVFLYFCWEKNSAWMLLGWFAIHLIISAIRALIVYPSYFKTQIDEQNINRWQRALVFAILSNSLTWGAAFIVFSVPDDVAVMLVMMFTFFVLQLSATSLLSPYMPAFYALTLPLMLSLLAVFFLKSDILHWDAVVVLILFSLVNLKFARAEHDSFNRLITLQFEKEELAQQLELSVEEKNRFLAAASHDLRQPLHASGLLLSALDRHVDSAAGKKILADITQSINALSESFSSLLDMSKLDAGVVTKDVEHVMLEQIVEDACGEFLAEAEAKGVSLNFSGPSVAVLTDVIQLERIIRNLVSNAVRYTKAGSVDVTWSENENNTVTLKVKDTGIGIPAADIDKIFSEYYQIDNPERDRRKGFGLGLAIVKRLCDLLELPLSVESTHNQGTCFTLVLPAGEKDKVVDRSVSLVEQKNLSNMKLLVIDDEESVRSGMRTLLESWGCTVHCVEGEQEAIALLNNLDSVPDMILADYRLRDNKTGVEACERIFDEFNTQIPVVIITGDTSPDRLQSVVSTDYQLLHKPVAPAQLRMVIQRQLLGFSA